MSKDNAGSRDAFVQISESAVKTRPPPGMLRLRQAKLTADFIGRDVAKKQHGGVFGQPLRTTASFFIDFAKIICIRPGHD